MQEHYYTCSEIAKITKKTVRTVHKWINAGKLKAIRPGGAGSYLIPESDFNAFMESDNRKGGGAA